MADEFSRSVARVVAAQIAEASGFDACQESAIEILADLLLRYLTTVCSSSHSYAELAGRSQSNLADLLLSLEELGVTAEDLHQHLELQRSDVPFAHTLAPFPVRTQRPVPPTFADQGEPHPAHLPAFLPAFPDPHTYQHTAAFAGHEADPHKQRQSMLEAKQKAEAALNKLHQRMSSKAAQPDINPFLVAPAVEQLPAQLPAATVGAAAAAPAPAPAVGAPGGGAPSTRAGAAADAAAPSAAAAAAQHGGSTHAPASAAADQQQQHAQLQLAQVQPQQQDAAEEWDDEDVLFEQAAVLKAFSSILHTELIAKELRGGLQEDQQQQQQRDKQPHELQKQQLDDMGVVEEQPMDVDGEGPAAAGAADGSAVAGNWLGWKQHQQQQGSGAAAAAAAGSDALAETEVLRFGIDSLAAGRRAALSLAGGQGPQDMYEQQAKQQGRVAGVGGARQRKSKYDADPKLAQAEGILNLGPEAVFNAVGGMHNMWDTGNGME
ncbi:Bromodomain associated-domain-containing protein [Scenedesmus sp. NREL 46B-D3]|nr:Bromodomain associated-domain-containing protein [Scenedesmus sp. NREL 46B-D3]